MPVSIVSNLASNYAQSSMRVRTENVSVSTQKLASGQRVFSAGEDAAALAVGTGLKIENAAFTKAQINAANGVSMLQVADGTLGKLQDILVRMKSLATQSSSGHYADGDRILADSEFQSLKAEVDRLSADTEFNGVFMLAGQQNFTLDEAHTISADGISEIEFDGAPNSDATYRYSYDSTTEQMTMTRISGGTATSQTIDMTTLIDGVGGSGNNLTGGSTVTAYFHSLGVNVTINSTFDRAADILPTITDNSGADIALTTAAYVPATTNVSLEGIDGIQALPGANYSAVNGDLTLDLDTNGTTVLLTGVAGLRFAVNGGAVGASGAASTNLVGATTYVDVYVDTVTAPGYERIGRITTAGIATSGTTDGQVVISLGQGMIGADYTGQTADLSLSYLVGSGVTNGQDLIDVTVPATSSAALGIDNSELTTLGFADQAITDLLTAMDTVNQARARIGAQQSRLEQAAQGIGIRIEGNEAARSALLDVDASAEISKLATDQAMLEVGVSMLSQANRMPQIMLELLRNA